jgi:hypothetical protein
MVDGVSSITIGGAVMVKFNMTFVLVDFTVMDMENKYTCLIMVGRPFLRTTHDVIDSKKGNEKF